jgi:diguanylate cyclase
METLPESNARRIVASIARMRIFGLALGLAPVLVVLKEHEAPLVVWLLAFANGLLWPWVAKRLALAHANPLLMERRNLLVDSFMGGVWVALMQFNVVPSLVVTSMLLMDKFAFGGTRLAMTGFGVFLAGATLIGALNDFAFKPDSSTLAALATLPLLIVYPSAIALSAHTLSERVRRQSARLELLSRTDHLTGLANRRALLEATEHEFRRFRRSGHGATFMMIDIDRFKQLNDRLGHAAGDEALKAVAKVLRSTLRDTDTCGRLGGDEFGVVLADASGGGVGELAERLRHAVASIAIADDSRPTISIGYAQVDASMANSAQWIAAADAALYAAKTAGRNRSMGAPAQGGPCP